MDVSAIAKECTRLNKQSINNLFDILTLFQDQTETASRYWAHQMGVDTNGLTAVDQWQTVLKQGRDDARNLVNDCFTKLEVHFNGIDPKQPTE